MRGTNVRKAIPPTPVGAKIRTVAFLVAMTPLLIVVALVGILSLFVLSPVVIYAGSIRGKPLKHGASDADAAPG
ncbi:MAG: hypothetical protein ACLP5H_31655 [Desulfomonilaceae bacterium]